MTDKVFIATTGNGLARASRDAGGQWEVERVLSGSDVRCLAVDPLNPQRVVVGIEAGATAAQPGRDRALTCDAVGAAIPPDITHPTLHNDLVIPYIWLDPDSTRYRLPRSRARMLGMGPVGHCVQLGTLCLELFRQPCVVVHWFHSFIKTEISAKPRFRSKGCGSESNVLLASISFFL